VGDAHNLAWKLALVTRGVAGPGLLDSYGAERRPIGELTVEQAYTRYVLRVDNTLPKDDMMPPLDDPSIELGAIYRSTAVLADQAPERPLDDPHARTWAVGARAPHVPLAGDGEASSVDAAGQDFALLVDDGLVDDGLADDGLAGDGLDLWRRAAAEASEAAGVDIAVRQVDPGSFPPAAGSGGAGAGWTGAALLRPDGVIAWKPPAPAAEAASQLAGVMASLLSRGG
jgi:hypothetical protein